jgi:hypothetical protein
VLKTIGTECFMEMSVVEMSVIGREVLIDNYFTTKVGESVNAQSHV